MIYSLLPLVSLFLFITQAHALPSFDEVKNSYKKSDAVLLDRHGEVIHELRVDERGRRLDWKSIKDISPSLIKAVTHSEDKRFFEHNGIDWRAFGAALLRGLASNNDRGASTITMQLASILDKGLRPKDSRRTLSQKWKQIRSARLIENSWSKEEILEAYLNLITFRGELQGISSASRGLFDKEPSGLDESESLILASLIRSPNARVNDVIKRACMLGDSIKSQTDCEGIRKISEKKLSGPYYIKPRIALAPHVARELLRKEGVVVSTLDGEIQRFATDVLKYQLGTIEDKNVQDGAVLIVENKTGDVIAYVANSGQSSSARFVDGIRARRQVGSTLKPFLYELAIEKRLLTSASLLDDSPLDIPTPVGLYIPQNYDNEFKGLVSVRTALSASLNVPAVRTLMLIGIEPFVARLKELGFENLNELADYYGFSIALGSADISLFELVNAYRTLANDGRWSEPKLSFDEETNEKQVLEKEAVFIISNILSDREARSVTFGLENPLSTRYWTAVKTGTSKDMRDNWCIGYSQKYTVGVWVGNFTGEPMWNVTGVTGAAPIWLEIMNYLHRGDPSIPPDPPSGVSMKRVEFQKDIEPERNDWFINGTEANSIELNTHHVNPHISYPPKGSIIALDPDIPEGHHLIFFEAKTPNIIYYWVLNNKKLGSSNKRVSWKPKRGKYVLSLVDNQGHVIDSVEFEVR
ncbi:MAG: penicillin-binding protein 1C [Candidatus Dadabacteria bacterium]|nr:penicillin-binding protein 1C [Candidatus Dadabacteria bacterium]